MKSNSFITETLLICLGNEYRHDDGLGLFIGRHAKIKGLKKIRIIENAGDCMSIIDAWKDKQTVILVDAVRSGKAVGTVFSFDALTCPFPDNILPASSHEINISECIALSRNLGMLPEKLIFYGIEGDDYGEGKGLTPAVKKAAETVMTRIVEELQT